MACFGRCEMPISGLILTTRPGSEACVLDALRAVPGVTLGEPMGSRVPLVAEAPTLRAARDLTETLMRMDGVAFVDVVSVDFQDEEL